MSPTAPTPDTAGPPTRVLWLSTAAFTLMFNVWLMLGILSKPVQEELKFSASQMEWLVAAAILSGAVLRLNVGVWADQYGGRRVMATLLLVAAVPAYLFGRVETYPQALGCALLFGLAGNSFAAGIAWNSAWFPPASKGLALGVFGAGNVGAAGTKLLVLLVPGVLTAVPAAGLLGGVIPGGWRVIPAVYAVLLVLMGVLVLLLAPTPDRKPAAGRKLREMLRPLVYARVWRFSLYYVVVFGAYVALAAWLPMFLVNTYQDEGMTLRSAALVTALFIFPASLLRPVGGWLSDRYGPRAVTYAVFGLMAVTLAALSVPGVQMPVWAFAALLFVVGCGMGIGKASVYKYIPNYFPNDVGAVGGLVGLFGALGGFVLPPLFGAAGRATGHPQVAFAVLLALTLVSLGWLHATVRAMRRAEGVAGPLLCLTEPEA